LRFGFRRRLAEKKDDLDRIIRLQFQPCLESAARIETSANAVGKRPWADKRSGLIERAITAQELGSVAGP
jgi:hypothetical protein